MRRTTYVLIAGMLAPASTEAQSLLGRSEFQVAIGQHGTELEILNGSVLLERAAFDVVLEFPQPMAVLVHASFDSTTHHLARMGAPMDQLPGFTESGMAEGLFNADEEVMLSTKAPGYWHYESIEDNRFTKVEELEDGSFRCFRRISQCFDVDAGNTLSIAQVEGPLYLVFLHRTYGQPEIQRKALALRWVTP